MRKSLALAVFVAGAMHGQLASALGVGDIATASTLNQPFKAFIPLRDAKGLEAAQLRVELADQQAFKNAGIDRTQFLNSLEFLVEVGDDGRGRIVVSTPQPVVEPYLDFIVEVRWPNGRMLREYTVLLDLPEFSSAPVVAPTASSATVSTPAAPSSADTPSTAAGTATFTSTAVSSDSAGARRPRPAAEQTALPASGDDGAYRVQHHDTMWRIASRLRPSADVTTEQTMIAVLRKNPDAFIGNNVNRIKSGYLLQAPTEAEAKALNKQDALEEVRKQARDWRSGRVSPSSTVTAPSGSQLAPQGPQLDATSAAEAKPETDGAADDVRFSIGSAGEGAEGGEGELEQRLQQEQEALEKAQLENAAMASRVREMEKQIDTLQKLIALKNSELAALQAGASSGDVAAEDESVTGDADAVESASDMVTEETAADEESIDSVAAAESAVSAEPEVAVESAAEESTAEESVPPQTSSAPATASAAWYETPLYRYLAAGVALFLLLVLALRRRARGEEPREPSFDNLAVASDDAQAAETPVEGAEGESSEGSDALATDAISNFDFDSLDDSPVDTDDENSAVAAESANEPVQAQTSDVISEAEIYVAYGRYDQAASLLKTAIANEPENTELQCKLLDIYLDTRDRDNFLDAYRQLEASGDSAALAQVKESMSAIEGVSDWLEADAETASASDALDDLDEELAFLDDETPKGGVANTADAPDELSFDESVFDESAVDATISDDNARSLESDAEPVVEGEPEVAEDELADFELDLDSDFDLDSLDSLEASSESPLSSSLDEDSPVDAESDSEESVFVAENTDEEFSLDDAFLSSAGESEAPAVEEQLETPVTTDGAEPNTSAEGDELDLADFNFNMDDLSTANDASADSAEPTSVDLSDDTTESELGDFDLDDDTRDVELSRDEDTLPELTTFDSPDDDLGAVDIEVGDEPALEISEGEGSEPELDLDSALAELDAEVEGLSFAEDKTADNDEQLLETLVDTADAEVDDDPAVSLGDGDSELDLNDLVFDEFSVDAMDADGEAALSDSDDVANKLDLARAFADMGDGDSARDLLTEVIESGDDAQKAEAQSLLDQLH